MSRSPSSWFRRIATGLLAVLLLGLVLFFGLTRTEVGRNGLRIQLERQFNARFEGTLHIGTLDGNLINTLFASDVQVRGPGGQVVVQADSVVLRPTWQALINRTLTLRSVDVHTVHVIAEQTDTGTPLAQAFARTDPPEEPTGPSVNLSLPHLRLHDARLTTRQSGPPPPSIANGWMADLLNTTVELPKADVQVQWSPAGRYADVDLRNVYHPASDLTIEQLSGRLERTDTGWQLPSASLTTPNSSIAVDGTWARDLRPEAPFALSVQGAPIDLDEWRALLPRLPQGAPIRLQADVRGPLNELVVETIQVRQGAAELSVEGTAVGFPNDVDVEGAVRVRNLTRTVMEDWLPKALPPAVQGAFPLSGEVYGQGQVRAASIPDRLSNWRPGSAEGTVEVTAASEAGRFEADTELEWVQDAPLEYEGLLQAEQFTVDALLPEGTVPRTQITGRLSLNGTGLDPRTAIAEARFTLMPSVLVGGTVQGAESRITLSEGTMQGTATLVQAEAQELSASWNMDALTARGPAFDIALRATAFDASPWGGPWQRTQLNGRVEAQAQLGRGTITEGALSVQVDSSSVTPAAATSSSATPRTIPAHTLTATLAPPSNATSPGERVPRLTVQGDVLSVTAGGTGWMNGRLRLVPTWAQALAETIAYEHAADGVEADMMPIALRRAVGLSEDDEPPVWQAPEKANGPFTFWGEAHLHRPDVAHAWVSGFPRTANDLMLQTDIYAAPDSVHATAQLTAQALHQGTTEAQTLNLQVGIGADDTSSLPERLRLTMHGTAEQVTTPVASTFKPDLRFSYAGRQGTLSFATGRRDDAGPIELEADLQAFDMRNELVIKHISATAGEYEWRLREASTWQLYVDRIIGTPLELTSTAALPNQEEVEQSIVVDGRFSPRPDDALNVSLQNVQLLPLSQLAGWSQPLGGQVNGALAIGGTWDTPVGNGDVAIDELSFDRRLLGDLSATARYVVGAPDMELSLTLAPTPQVDAPSDAVQALVPNGIQQVERNELDLSGRLRLDEDAPGWDEDEWIDLSLNIGRADLFFFDFIFTDVLSDIEGSIRGSTSISGRWSRPVFDADLAVDGAFSIPRFGLSYTLNGPVQVDRRGIHLREAQLADQDEGTAEIGGSILFNDYQFFSFDLESRVDNLTIMDVPRANDLPFYGFIRASGPVQLQGPLSNTQLTSSSARTSEDTEIFIPVVEGSGGPSSGFLIYADSTSQMLDWDELTRRANIFADRPAGETSFLDGMEIDLNIQATRGGRLHIVFDALVGDVITTEVTGRVQLQRNDGEFFIFGSMDVVGGTYLFTAGEVFVRRFSINEGTLSWDGDPINAELDIEAAFQTRASPAGLPGFSERSARIPVVIDLDITGRVETPEVALSLSLNRDQRDQRVGSQTFDALLNQEAQMTEFATSVLLTNTFLLTTETIGGANTGPSESGRLANTGSQLAFNSVSQLVSSQLNRYLSAALPNVDFNVGVQGETADNLDIIYGVALRLLDERLIIRGEGVYTGNDEFRAQQSGPQGEFAVEVRLSSQVSMEVFYRRTGDALTQGQTLTSTTGVGLFYQTQFSTWSSLWDRVTSRSEESSADTEEDKRAQSDATPPDTDPDEDIDMP